MAKKAAKKTAKKSKEVDTETPETETETPAKGKKEKKDKKKPERKKQSKGLIVYFMNSLIGAGYLGEEIPEESKDRNLAARNIRQMAEKLARATKNFEGEELPAGSEAGEDDEEDGEEGDK